MTKYLVDHLRGSGYVIVKKPPSDALWTTPGVKKVPKAGLAVRQIRRLVQADISSDGFKRSNRLVLHRWWPVLDAS
jgi:hypothetical protein